MPKVNIDKDGLDAVSKQKLENIKREDLAKISGIGCDILLEPIPKYISAKCEKVIEGQNNTWIVLGRDRPAHRLSGYGGKGHTQAGAIDIVVGRMSQKPKSNVYVEPDFSTDASRIYLSQKSNLDEYLNLSPGKVGNAVGKAGIGIKSDVVRIVGRESVKIVTGGDTRNSQGGLIDTTYGIDLIAGNNDTELQPIPKGENLAIALERMIKHIESLSGIVSTFLQSQMKFNSTAGTHFHTSPFYGSPTTTSTTLQTMATETQMSQMQDCMIGLQKFKSNLAAFKTNYLRNSGKKYINSRYNNVN